MGRAIRRAGLSTFLGEYFLDALRHTLSIVLPVWFLLDTGKAVYLPFGLGILLIGLTDLPGTVRDKLRTAIWSLGTLAVAALTLAFSLPHWWAMQVFWIAGSFVLCLFGAGGTRLGLVGTMCLILAIFIYGLSPNDPLTFTFWIFLGALWYHALSVLQVLIFPFRSLKQALFECLDASAALLSAKSLCYDTQTSLAEAYSETVEAQRRLAMKQEQVRHLLLSDPKIKHAQSGKGEYWLHMGLAVMELFEQINAIHFDYDHLRNVLDGETLHRLSRLIHRLSRITAKLALASLFRTAQSEKNIARELDKVMLQLQVIANAQHSSLPGSAGAVPEILNNAEAIVLLLGRLSRRDQQLLMPDINPYAFLPQTGFKWAGLSSAVKTYRSQWRYALRIAIVFGLLWLPVSVFHFGNYGYWIFLTVIVVSRPNFGQSWQRNLQRVWGTLAGLSIGVLTWYVLAGTVWTWIMASIFLFGFFWLQRSRYGFAVASISAAVVLLFAGEQGISFALVAERLLDTLIGCGAALVAAYLFPVWERRRLRILIGLLVQKQLDYLQAITRFTGEAGDLTRLRLARKAASASVATYADAIAQALVEPGHRRLDVPLLFSLRELGYRINAVLVGLALEAEKTPQVFTTEQVLSVRSNLEQMVTIIDRGSGKETKPETDNLVAGATGWDLLQQLTDRLLAVVSDADKRYARPRT
ncbi:FUSC family membrane protein [Pedobacter sp. SYP-B3415]|uniref:FUSC family membrane protein n=1 Tax=Pedobacter sp. SYP-B3415 TaxID=2496641 RepID=UPI00101CE620|nr:FUSC family membrane protein [Pedobacter sp. SYP-B3415]